ncbi:MAG: threonine ammonia-lyase [Beijerinckiaceae bacterium]|nr:threonine ammonia-lyase [Beijerinckiaceae bacterium]
MIELEDVEAAAQRLQGVVTKTPFLPSRVLSKLTGAEVFIKFENLQFTGSFKDRGALNKLASLDAAALKAGVCAMSAGNHAQGVAWVASRMDVAAVIVMPKATPITKIESTRAHGAEVVLCGDTLEEAAAQAHQIARERGLTFIHPYDDPLVAAGQGTVGLEIARSGVPLDAIICPVGGGGLISGVSTAIKALCPRVHVYGVQSACFPTLVRGPKPEARGATIADGIAVKSPGRMTSRVIAARVDDIFAVEERWIEEAVALLINIEKTVAEGAGAVPLALLLRDKDRFAGKRVALILSGGNIDARLLSSLLVRELVREMRIVTLRIAVADQPGFLASAATLIADAGANVIEVHHFRSLLSLPAREAVMELTLEARGPEHAAEILRRLNEAGYQAAFAG